VQSRRVTLHMDAATQMLNLLDLVAGPLPKDAAQAVHQRCRRASGDVSWLLCAMGEP
jgi:hypothetical protein